MARRIHASGQSPDGPFVDVPFAALDAAAADAALYGDGPQGGRIELARGGSLFLDEVDRLEGAAQRRLAGGLRARDFDVVAIRVIASAAMEPEAVEPSLIQLIDVIRIQVPPLRERREDLPLFAERFMLDTGRGRSAGRRIASRRSRPSTGRVTCGNCAT